MTAPEKYSTSEAIRLIVVEAYEVVARTLIEHLEAVSGFEVVGQATTIAEATTEIAQLEPDVVVLDTRLPDGSGLDLCRQVPALSPGTRCVIHTGTHVDEIEAKQAGASAVVLKELIGSGLVAAIRRAAGETGRHPSLHSRTDNSIHDRSPLT